MLAALIDLSNYDTHLVQSTQSRSGTPDGNIFFDTANGRIELITAEELANVDLGSGAEANPLTQDLGIKKEALYAFENQERRTDEALRKFDRYFKGTFKFGGAYELVNAMKYDDVDGSNTGIANNSAGDSDDRVKVRGSGWIERNVAGAIGRIYYGVKSLGNIEALSQPFYQLSDGGAPVDFAKDGPIDEAVQVYGDITIDTNTTTFDTRTYLSNKIRTFGYNFDEKVLIDSGVSEMGGYFTGFALGESSHLTSDNYTLADVYGGAQVSPWTGMTLEKLAGATSGAVQIDVVAAAGTFTRASGDFTTDGFAIGQTVQFANFTNGGNNADKIISNVTSTVITVSDTTGLVDETGGGDETATSIGQTETGFTTADGVFSWVVNNTVPGNLDQVVAFLDALAQTDDDIDSGALTVTNGKRVGTWYTYNAEGKILPKVGTGVANEGLFIEGLVGTDKNRVVFTDDTDATKIYPSYSNVSVAVGADAVADSLAWFHAFFLDGPAGADYNTSLALTVEDASAVEVKGNVDGSGFRTGNNILFEFDWYLDTIGGPIETDKDCVFLCEGDGGVTQAKTVFTLTSAASITASCTPLVENNV